MYMCTQRLINSYGTRSVKQPTVVRNLVNPWKCSVPNGRKYDLRMLYATLTRKELFRDTSTHDMYKVSEVVRRLGHVWA